MNNESIKIHNGFWNGNQSLKRKSRVNEIFNHLLTVLCAFAIFTPPLFANPTGGQVTAGSATITSPNSTTVQINQSSNKAVIDWKSYNISPQEQTRYIQPSSSAITLNRIDPNNGASFIAGRISANGQVWLINPAGVVFGAGSHVDVAGLLVTTANISNQDFMNGNYHFIQSPDWHGAVINNGTITIADEGLAAIVAPGIRNNGIIKVNLGRVVLASGNEYTVDFYGDHLIEYGINAAVSEPSVSPSGKVLKDAVSNSGTIIANGGKVLLTAQTAGNLLDHAINMSGHIIAQTAVQKGGTIILSGGENGPVEVSGKINASGNLAGQKGGTVKILGKEVELIDNAKINASGNSGGGTILIGGNAHGAGPELNADYAFVGSNVKVYADALANGNGGKVVVWSNLGTEFYGNISAAGGIQSGNGGWIETSGHAYLDAEGNVNASATNGLSGTWLLDPFNVTISTGTTANGTYSGGIFTPTGNTAVINVNSIIGTLNNGANVTINTGTAGIQAGNITVSNNITKTTGSDALLTLDASATSAGKITINAGISSTANKLAVALNTGTTTGSLSFGASGSISTNGGDLTVAGGATRGALSLGNINTGTGNLSVTSTGNAAISQTAALVIGGTTTVSTGGAAITLTNASNSLIGVVSLTNTGAHNISLKNSTALALGTISMSTASTGKLTVNSNGAISQDGPSTITTGTGAVSFNSGTSGADIILTNNNSFNGAVSLTNVGANNIAITATGALKLGIISMSSASAGMFSIISNGNITQNGTNTITSGTGAVSFNAGTGSITLTNSNKFAGPVSLTNFGTNNISITDSGALTLDNISMDSSSAGTLTVKSNGIISQNGSSIITTGTGAVSFNSGAAGADIILTNNNSFNGAVALTNVGTHNIDIAATGALTLGTVSMSNVAGSLTVNSNGAITQSGTTIITSGKGTVSFNSGVSGADITLTNNNNFRGAVSLTNIGSNNIAIKDSGALKLDNVSMSASSAGSLTVTSNGALTQNGSSTITTGTGAVSIDAGNGAITLTNANNFNGPVALTNLGARNVDINAAGDLTLDNISMANAGGTLTVNSNGIISQNGSSTITSGTGLSSFNSGAAGADIILTNANDFRGAVNLTTVGAHNISISDSGALKLGTISMDSTSSGSLSVISNGNITQNGTNTITSGTGLVSFNAGNGSITLTHANNFAGPVVLTNLGANNILITYSGALTLDTISMDTSSAGTLTINSHGTISQNGSSTITTGTGAVSFNSGISGADIILTNNNSFNGAVALTNVGANNIAITSAGGLTLGTVSMANGGGTLTVNSNGDITQNGTTTITSGTGVVSFNSHAGAITLTNNNNFRGTVSLANSGANDINLKTSGALIIGSTNVGQNLSLTANGTFSQTGAINAANGRTSIAAGSTHDITLNNVGNDFGTIAITTGRNVTLADINDINFGTSTISGTLNINAGSSITQTGALAITGSSTFTVTSANSDILLADTGNNFHITPTITNNGNVRDLSYNNSAANTSIPSLPTGMRNLTLMFENANMLLPSVTLNGNLSATATGTLTTEAINTNGNVALQTISPDSLARVLTINGNIKTSGGSITATATNQANSVTALIVNGLLDTTGGSSQGTLTLGGGVALNTMPIVGGGNITLQGNSQDLTLGNLNFSTPLTFSVNRYIYVTGALSTSGTNSNLNLIGDRNNTGIGGVIIESGASLNSSGNLTIQGSSLTGATGATSTAGIEIQNGVSISANGSISLLTNSNSQFIAINSPSNSITISQTGAGTMQFGANIISVTPSTLALQTNIQSDIDFNGNLGSSSAPLASLNISSVRNVNSNGTINTGTFTELAGVGTTSLINLNASRLAYIATNNVTGNLSVGELTLNDHFANLSGTVQGMHGKYAINVTNLSNSIKPKTHFFDGLDMFFVNLPDTIPQNTFIPNIDLNNIIKSNTAVTPSSKLLKIKNRECESISSGIEICI